MKDRIGTTRRTLEYYSPHALQGSFSKAARMHGYTGLWGTLLYSILKTKDYILSQIAYFAPYNGIRIFCHRMRGVKIGKNVLIGFHCVLDESFPDFITIEDNVSLAGKVYILTHSNPYEHFKGRIRSYVAPVVIKQGAWLTINCTILPGVTIGENTIVTAGAVVAKSVPDNCVVQGNPAEVIKEYTR